VWSVQEDLDQFKRTLDISLADPNIDVAILDKHVWGNDDGDPEHQERHRKVDEFYR